ncbi:hypothetical protein ACROYT_G025039 [Oculina patagonica]
MAKKAFVKLLLLLMLAEVLLVPVTAWRRRRRRRCPDSKPSGYSWDTSWLRPFSISCANGQSLDYWRSMHRDCKEDRVHYFGCGYGPVSYSSSDCSWTANYVNDFDKPVSYKCPHNGFITGIKGVHDGYYKDRRWGFRCCHVEGYYAHTCQHTSYQNSWDDPLFYSVPSGYYLVGVYSYHDDYYEDRRWKFEICKFSKSYGK